MRNLQIERRVGDREPLSIRVELPTPTDLSAIAVKFFMWRTNHAKTRLVDGAALSAAQKEDISASESKPLNTVWRLTYDPGADGWTPEGIHLAEFEADYGLGQLRYYPEPPRFIAINVQAHKGTPAPA